MIKNAFWKRHIAKIMAVMMGVAVFITPNITVNAAMSDEVPVSVNQPGLGIVTTESNNLTVRNSPSLSATAVAYLAPNTKAQIVGRYSGFYKIQYNLNGDCGYVSEQYFEELSAKNYLEVNTGSDRLHFRKGAGTQYGYHKLLTSGTKLVSLTDNAGQNDWLFSLYGTKEGYVYGAHVLVKSYQQ